MCYALLLNGSQSQKSSDFTEVNASAPNQPETMEEKKEPTIHLDQFLKTCGVATGGQAKLMIQGGEILVNGEVETRRRKQLRVGDEVDWDGVVYVVSWAGDDSDAEGHSDAEGDSEAEDNTET